MKVVHFVKFGPRQSGLYETARELVLAERDIGIDAQVVDFDGKDHKEGMEDRGIVCQPMSAADDCDVIVRHSAVPTKLQYLKPVVMALHGRPESSFRLEQSGNIEVISGIFNKGRDARYKRFITFWEEYLTPWRMIVPNTDYVPAMVDLEAYYPRESKLDATGSPNVLIADIWRDDITPFNMIFAAVLARQKLPHLKLHFVGLSDDVLKVIKPYLTELNRRGMLGQVAGMRSDIKDYYAMADLLITPHVIATRVIREASAMDVPIVAGAGCKYTPYQANPNDCQGFADAIVRAWCSPEEYSPRETAEGYFNPKQSAKAMKRVLTSVLETGRNGRKVFVDLGGHIGETVRRFYREVPDAPDWDIFTFEPMPEALRKNVGFIPNVNIIDAVAATETGEVPFYTGEINDGEGSTTIEGKKTGRLTGETKVRSIDFAKWLGDTTDESDYIVVKMNIEGGEYPLMKQLSANGVMKRVDQFYIDTHSHKFPDEQAREFEAIAKEFISKAKFVRTAQKGAIPFECV